MEIALSELAPFLDKQGRLTALPAKNKKKLLAIWYLSGKIEIGRQYTEGEINDLLDDWTTFRDHATLRRELYNKFLLNRSQDGRLYWKEREAPTLTEFVAKYI